MLPPSQTWGPLGGLHPGHLAMGAGTSTLGGEAWYSKAQLDGTGPCRSSSQAVSVPQGWWVSGVSEGERWRGLGLVMGVRGESARCWGWAMEPGLQSGLGSEPWPGDEGGDVMAASEWGRGCGGGQDMDPRV